MPSLRFRYPEVETLLGELHKVDPQGRVALMGRIKNFQRKGWPRGTNSGRGKPAEYGISALTELLMAFEFSALRVPPDQTVHLLQGVNWTSVAKFLRQIGRELERGLEDKTAGMLVTLGGAAFLVFDPDGLSGLRRAGDPEADQPRLRPFMLRADEGELEELLYAGSRFASVNLTRVFLLASIAMQNLGIATAQEFGRSLAGVTSTNDGERLTND